MNALWIAMMVVGLIGMIVCSKKQKTAPIMQPIAFGLFIVVVIGAIMLLKGMFGGDSPILNKEMAVAHSRGYMVGKFLKEKAAGKKVLFVADPIYAQSKTGGALVDGFKKAYGSDNIVFENVKLAKASEEASIEELARLIDTAGGECFAAVTQNREAPDVRTCIGKGKIEELKDICGKNDISLVVFDCELSPSQIRNIEEELGGPDVIDRSMLILETNNKSLANFADFEHIQHKRRRAYIKEL